MSLTLENVPLFAFATEMEFSKVFPEDSLRLPNSQGLIPLGGLFEGCYACVLDMGILNFTANLTRILCGCRQSSVRFSAVVNMGICGAYPDRGLSLLDVVRVDRDVLGDYGCRESDGSFTSWGEFYSGSPVVLAPTLLRNVICNSRPALGVTVNCCTGTELMASERTQKFDCDVESMEGAACFAVCKKLGIPAFQIRVVSNVASVRDKSQWKINEALQKLRELLA